MANYLTLMKRGFERKFLLNFKNKLPKDDIDVIVCSPGGCGNVTLNNFLEKFCISNNALEKNFKIPYGMMHLPKPLKEMKKRKIKIILLKRDYEEIYESHKKRNFLRNALIFYGDIFSFYKFKDEKYLKKKFLNFLEKYYKDWSLYPENLKLEIEYNDLWNSSNKIKEFLNIKEKSFFENFPEYSRYKY